ncbi:major facilitator superfamily transporter [Kutzneria sp. 744]|nr:major facilitator superfamily transporter [Kutzneria sp. 744]
MPIRTYRCPVSALVARIRGDHHPHNQFTDSHRPRSRASPDLGREVPMRSDSPHRASTTAADTLGGTTVEWYDFFLYGTASALVFNKQFFPALSPAAGTLAAFATLTVGFIARPLGGLILGHFGDRIGGRATLVVSLLVMGISSTLIGVVPNYAAIGVCAPVLLVLLRVLQGIWLGGGGAGTTLMSMEHAPEGRRNLYAGFPQMGTPAGLVLANLVFLGVGGVTGPAAFAAWGWRIPFLLSIVLVAIGLAIRLRVTESPSFDRFKAHAEVARFPLGDALRVGLARLAVTLLAVIANSAVAYVFLVFALSFGTQRLGYGQQFLVLGITGASVLWLAAIPFWTRFADRHGRRGMFLGGSVALLLWCAAFFPLLSTGNTAAALVALAGMGLIIPVTESQA